MTCPACCFYQAEDGIRDLVRSRGLGDVYKRQPPRWPPPERPPAPPKKEPKGDSSPKMSPNWEKISCLLYTSDAADERSSVDLGGRRIIKNTSQAV